MAGFNDWTPEEEELLHAVRSRTWVHRGRNGNGNGNGNGDGPPPSLPDEPPAQPWWRRRIMALALVVLVLSWMGWPVAMLKHREAQFRQGEADEAQRLADDRADILAEQRAVHERMRRQRDALLNALDQAVSDFELLMATERSHLAAEALEHFAATGSLETQDTQDLQPWREAMDAILAEARAAQLAPNDPAGAP
jgi:hypothetical protein